MKKTISVALASFVVAAVSAQQGVPAGSSSPAPTVSSTTPATAADVEALRQQVQSLTETVNALQQTVKDQQAALEKANLTGESGLPSNPEPPPLAGAESSPSPAASAAPQFPRDTKLFRIPLSHRRIDINAPAPGARPLSASILQLCTPFRGDWGTFGLCTTARSTP